jgi:hypothetical protein
VPFASATFCVNADCGKSVLPYSHRAADAASAQTLRKTRADIGVLIARWRQSTNEATQCARIHAIARARERFATLCIWAKERSFACLPASSAPWK